MDDPREILKQAIRLTIEGLKHLAVDDAADLIAELADDIAEGGPEDLFHGAILDGVRWGYAAAVQVEMAGGAMLRVCLPGGIGITHEWADAATADPQIKAALAALHTCRVSASNVGADDE
jgi:hypothetical protein